MKNIKYLLPILVIFLTIGYAATNVTLSITGDAFIASDLGEFEVYISNTTVDDTVDLSLLSGEMEFSFTIDSSEVREEPYELGIELTNNSAKFDASINGTCSISNTLTTVDTKSFPQKINAKSSEYAIFIFDVASLEEGGTSTISCSFTAAPVERNSLGEGEVPLDIYRFEVGKVVSIGNEKFNVISDNGNTVTMLAQYNLDTSYRQSTTENAVTFSDVAGWTYSPGPKEIDIQQYDGNAKTYVNEYVSYLKRLVGDSSLTGNLISMTELKSLGCTITDDYGYSTTLNCNNSLYTSWLLNSQKMWTRSAFNQTTGFVWSMWGTGVFYYNSYNGSDNAVRGIRPIITVSKNALFKEVIEFAVDDVTYYAYKDMTWKEWVNSDFNQGDYVLATCNTNVLGAECFESSTGTYIISSQDLTQAVYLDDVINASDKINGGLDYSLADYWIESI